MNEETFLTELDKRLQQITAVERQDILEDFKEHFAMGREAGKSDAEIAQSLGSPQQISKELLASYHIERMETTKSPGDVLRAVWSTISLGFFNLVIVLGPFLALVGIMIAGWGIGIVLIGSPLLVFVNTIVHPSIFEIYDVFMSFVLCGIGLCIILGMFYATRSVKSLTIRYLKYNVRVVKGGTNHAT